jgi:hypothetical protein
VVARRMAISSWRAAGICTVMIDHLTSLVVAVHVIRYPSRMGVFGTLSL